MFQNPAIEKVSDYDGFYTEIPVCPECGCDEAFYEKIQEKIINEVVITKSEIDLYATDEQKRHLYDLQVEIILNKTIQEK
ncbi:hypothetical protein IEE86_16980 [Bacillus sp. 28A-2]|uniref:hypothetical protein n=1 Tax=Bacillus sp. 28A-2 TaxID=2772252 RepID=UPI00168CBCE3|nr:hypothetical protein [Bacillus sp. 28A-2]MBD3861422.1 hypothetical protein [Bacillus sp. 28A-2]